MCNAERLYRYVHSSSTSLWLRRMATGVNDYGHMGAPSVPKEDNARTVSAKDSSEVSARQNPAGLIMGVAFMVSAIMLGPRGRRWSSHWWASVTFKMADAAALAAPAPATERGCGSPRRPRVCAQERII
jgi:hypothetical protein